MKRLGFIFLITMLFIFTACGSIFESLDSKDKGSEEYVNYQLEEDLNEGNFDDVLNSVDEQIDGNAELSDINNDIAISSSASDSAKDAEQLEAEALVAETDALTADDDIASAELTIETKENELNDAQEEFDNEFNAASTEEQSIVEEIDALVGDADPELLSLEVQFDSISEISDDEIEQSDEELIDANEDIARNNQEITDSQAELDNFSLSSDEEDAIEDINEAVTVLALVGETEAEVEILEEEIDSLELERLNLENQISNAQASLSITRADVNLDALIARLNNITRKLESKTIKKEKAKDNLKHYNNLKKEAQDKKDKAILKLRADVSVIIEAKTIAEIKKGIAVVRKDFYTIKKAEAEKNKAEAKASLEVKKIEKAEEAIEKIFEKGDDVSDALETALNEKLRILKEKAEAEKAKANAQKAKAEAARLRAESNKADKEADQAQAANDLVEENNQAEPGYIENPTTDPLVEKWLNQKQATKTLMGYNLTKANALLGKANIKASNVLDKLIELNNNEEGSLDNVSITDIVTTYTSAQKAYLNESLIIYNSYLPNPSIFTEDKMDSYAEHRATIKELQDFTADYYLGLVVGTVIDTGNLLIEILNRYNDPSDEAVSYIDENGIEKFANPPALNAADLFTDTTNKVYLYKKENLSDISEQWDLNRDSVTDTLTDTKDFAKAYFDLINFYEYKDDKVTLKDEDDDDLSPNENLIVTLEDIINRIHGEEADMETKEDYNEIIEEVLTAIDKD